MDACDKLRMQNQTMQDELWMRWDDKVDEIVRIAMEGPSSPKDWLIIKSVLCGVAGSVYSRRDARTQLEEEL